MDQITINQNDNQEILINSNDPQIITLNNLTVQDIEINTNENQDLSINQPDNQVILINGNGQIVGISDVMVNGVSVVTDNIAYVIVPTKTSELTNDSGYLTSETDPTVPSYIKAISLADINNWNNKQDELVSGSNIKTINNTSLLGSGNIEIDGTVYTAGTGIDITNNVISNEITSYNDLTDLPTIPDKVSDLINDLDYVRENELSDVAFDGSYTSLSNTPQIPTNTSELINDGATGSNPYVMNLYPSGTINFRGIKVANDGKFYYVKGTNTSIAVQDELMSGINIKTINNQDILGAGNLTISGGTPTDVQINSTSITSGGVANIETKSNYNSSTNKIITENEISNMAVTNADNNFSANQTINGQLNVKGNSVTSNIFNASNFAHYETDGTNGHFFNKDVKVSGNVYGGSNYNKKLAFEEDVAKKVHVTWTNSISFNTFDSQHGIICINNNHLALFWYGGGNVQITEILGSGITSSINGTTVTIKLSDNSNFSGTVFLS